MEKIRSITEQLGGQFRVRYSEVSLAPLREAALFKRQSFRTAFVEGPLTDKERDLLIEGAEISTTPEAMPNNPADYILAASGLICEQRKEQKRAAENSRQY